MVTDVAEQSLRLWSGAKRLPRRSLISNVSRDCHQSTPLPERTAFSGAVYAHEVRIATFEFQKLVESGTSRLRNVL